MLRTNTITCKSLCTHVYTNKYARICGLIRECEYIFTYVWNTLVIQLDISKHNSITRTLTHSCSATELNKAYTGIYTHIHIHIYIHLYA